MRFHWSTRVAMLVALIAVLWWQSRYTRTIHNPMYGWPMPFNNVWYRGYSEWRPSVLLVDAIVWIAVTVSAGIVIERFRSQMTDFRFSLIQLLGIQTVTATLLMLGFGEHWLRANPNNGSIIPKYARWEVAGIDIWFDIGLFSDPLHISPIVRLTVILAIGCAIYVGGSMTWTTLRRLLSVRQHREPHQDFSTEPVATLITKEPTLARLLYWVLIVGVVLMLLTSLFPPAVR